MAAESSARRTGGQWRDAPVGRLIVAGRDDCSRDIAGNVVVPKRRQHRLCGNERAWTAAGSTLPRRSAPAARAQRTSVKVEGGWVTLSGEVDWDYQRKGAADGVRYLMGVTGVSDQIVIKAGSSSGAVKSDIEAALKRRATADAKHISVDVHGHDVTLSGTVHSRFERDLASDSAWGTPGLRNVVNNIAVAF